MTTKIALGMSGGVDSSTSALLLQQQGYDVTGVYLAGLYPGPKQDAAIADARAVATLLGIDFQVLDAGDLPSQLFDYFVSTYRAGHTPNVCTVCNRRLKFGYFFQWALEHGFDAIATGHYARLKTMPDGQVFLRTAKFVPKDQTYFLSLVDERVLSHVRFPVGELTKPEVRALAAAHGLPVADKAESMEVCFLQNQRFTDFVTTQLPSQPGDIVTPEGSGYRVIGTHQGLHRYTLGQRQGLHIIPTSTHTPVYYVTQKLYATNQLVVDTKDHLGQTEFFITDPTARLRDHVPVLNQGRALVRIRHHGQLTPVTGVSATSDTPWGIQVSQPIIAPTPGQFATFYLPDPDEPDVYVVIGGAPIAPAP
ncbi:tRNA 2-thiouridine(34) synthase MnmA [bacterium]|nr:tRNA 2-thiouridine(34) synthase MnmA [bacterium]